LSQQHHHDYLQLLHARKRMESLPFWDLFIRQILPRLQRCSTIPGFRTRKIVPHRGCDAERVTPPGGVRTKDVGVNRR
jgi:hypothetical protein